MTRKSRSRKSTASSSSTAVQPSVVPPYNHPPKWVPAEERFNNSNYNNNLITFLPRKVHLRRNVGNSRLGLFIRGGPESEYGVFISMVKESSEAERVGLKCGDKILSINSIDCSNIEHEKVVSLLQQSESLELKVQYFPHGYALQRERIGMI